VTAEDWNVLEILIFTMARFEVAVLDGTIVNPEAKLDSLIPTLELDSQINSWNCASSSGIEYILLELGYTLKSGQKGWYVGNSS